MGEINLEKLKVTARQYISPDLFTLTDGIEVQKFIDYELRAIVLNLTSYILAEEVENRQTVVHFEWKIPANWWEHFKTVLPIWAHRFLGKPQYRKHVKNKKVTFRRLATYPKARITFPELGDTVIYRTQFNEECY